MRGVDPDQLGEDGPSAALIHRRLGGGRPGRGEERERAQ
jgi:hypothetical protein